MRVLVTGLGTFWGSHLAQRLEAIPDVEMIVGLDTEPPRLPLERTEFVRADSNYSILDRIVRATQVDTILHTHLIVDSTELPGRALHEINVIGTMNLLAAAGAAGSPVRKVIVKSSALTYGANYQDPYFFRETMPRTRPPRTRVERSLLEAASFVRDFAIDNPHVTVTKLRFTNVLGDDVTTPFSKALRLPLVPEVFGFDPRLQFTHESDVTGALVFATLNDVPGVFNIAGDGSLPWSEVCAIVGRRRIALPPLLTQWAAEPLRIAADPRPAARGAQPAPLRPRPRQQPVQAHRLPLPVLDRRHRRRVRPQPPARERGRGATGPRTCTSATSRRSSATRPPSCARSTERRCPCTSNGTTASRCSRSTSPSAATRSPRRSSPTSSPRWTSSTPTPPSARSSSPARRPRSAPAPTSRRSRRWPRGREEPGDVRAIYAGFLRILDSPLPTVAAVNGAAVGAGCNLALACDVRIAGTSAMFDARFLRIGIHPGGGHTWLLDRAAGPQTTAAMDLFGERLDGARAAAVGLAWECVRRRRPARPRAGPRRTRAAEVPRELAIRTKATIRHTAGLDAHDAAMRFELVHQVWSLRGEPRPRRRTQRRR